MFPSPQTLIRLLVAALIVAAPVQPLVAGEPSADRPPELVGELNLDALLRAADAMNPAIAAARENAQAAEGAMLQAGLLPNPVLRVTEEDVPLEDVDVGEGRSTAAIGQPLPIGGRLGAARSVEQARVEAEAHRLHDVRHQTFLRVEELYIQLLYLGEAERLQWRQMARAEEVSQLFPDSGAGDAPRAAAELAERHLGLIRIATNAQIAMRDLRAELRGAPLERGQITGELASRLDPAYVAFPTDAALRRHPALLAAESAATAADRDVELARREAIPDVTVLAGGGWNASMDESFGMVGLEIPIPLFDRRQGSRAQARSLANAAREEAEGTREMLRADIDRQLMLVNELDTLVSDYATELIPFARVAYTQSTAVSSPDGLTVVDAMRTLNRLEGEQLAYRRDLNLAMARLRHYLLAEPRSGAPEPGNAHQDDQQQRDQ